MWILFDFGYDMRGGRWVRMGGGMVYNNILRRLDKQMVVHLVSKHKSVLIVPHHTPPLRMTHRAALAKKSMAMCHPAPTLQIAQQAGPNYNNHTNRATHRPTWLEGASLSCLIYDAPRKQYCPIGFQCQGTTLYNLHPPPPPPCFPGRVSSASLIVSRTETQPLISVCALLA